MDIDHLEPRRLMAGGPVLSPPVARLSSTGSLYFTGGDQAESVRIHYRPSGRVALDVVREVGGNDFLTSVSFKRSEIKRLNIATGIGDDVVRIDVDDLAGRSKVYGGPGDDRLTTRAANTELFGEAGNDVLTSDRPWTERPFTPPPGMVGAAVQIFTIDASYNALYGGRGADTLRSAGGEDTLVGGSGTADRYEALWNRIDITHQPTLPALPPADGAPQTASRVAIRDIEGEVTFVERARIGSDVVAAASIYVYVPSLRASSYA